MDEAIKNNDLLSYRKIHKETGKIGTPELFYLALELSRLEFVEYLYLYNCSHDTEKVLDITLRIGNDDIMDLVFYKNNNYEKAVEYCIIYNRINKLKLLMERRGTFNYNELSIALQYNRVEILEYLSSKTLIYDKKGSAYDVIVRKNDLQSFTWLINHKYRKPSYLLSLLVELRRLEMLKVILDGEVRYGDWYQAVIKAVSFGHLDILKLLSNKYTIGQGLTDLAIEKDRLEILKYLIEERKFEVEGMYYHGDLSSEMSKYLHTKSGVYVDWLNAEGKCEICETIETTLSTCWEMDTIEYTNYIQWLPNEVLEATSKLIDTHVVFDYE